MCPDSENLSESSNFGLNDLMDKEQDPAVLSKRKKQLENMKKGTQKEQKRPRYEWTQSLEDVTMSLKLEGVKGDQIRNIDVQFADTDVTLKLQDGRSWTWTLQEEIFRERSRVRVKKQKITLHMKKKKPIQWDSLEPPNACASPVPAAETSCDDDDEITPPTGTTESQEPVNVQDSNSTDSGTHLLQCSETVQASSSDDSGAHLLLSSEALTDLQEEQSQEPEDVEHEKLVKDEEPVYQLTHVKNDFIETEDLFHVHIYVKGVNKDNVRVVFEKKSFSVKFQTGNQAFLKLYPDTSDDTVFCWTIQLRGETIPEKNRYKLSPSCIELVLFKTENKRWGDLEALKRKETPAGSKSDSWVPINNVAPASDTGFSTSDSAIGTVRDADQEKEVQEEKTDSATVTSSPQIGRAHV